MKKLLILITILLLVSCSKEKEKQIYDKWIVYESYSRQYNQQSWLLQEDVFECKITKDSWKPLIQSKCYIGEYGEIITEESNVYTYSYNYSKITDEIQFNVFLQDGTHIWKRFLKRK